MILQSYSNILFHGLRAILAWIDSIVYWALMEVYNLIDQITRINLFGESTLSEFSNRIYTIIGVLMLFKLAFSIINYIIDPDKLADNKKGFAGIVKNIIIMLALIVTVPLIFKYAMALQYVVVSDNTIGRLITGKEGATTDNVGDNMSVAILSGFIHPDSGILPAGSSVTSCENYSEECKKALKKYKLDTAYEYAYTKEQGYKYLVDLAQSTQTMGDGNYVIVYNFILSTLVGAFATWILLMFCIDIAIRIVKLGFLQLIAPIPIVTYMDDGGQGVFKKWVKTCTSTYIDLFVRLAAIDFAIYIISVFLISGEGNNALMGNFKMCEWTFDGTTLSANCDNPPGVFVRLFLILGTLMFAKQLPKLIEDITGLKMDGKFTLNPIKKMQEVPLVGGVGAKALGLAGRTGLNIAKGVGTAGLAIGKAVGGAGAGLARNIAGKAGGKISNMPLLPGGQMTVGQGLNTIGNSRWVKGAVGIVKSGVTGIREGAEFFDDLSGHNFSKIGTDISGTLGGGTYAKKIDKQAAILKRVADFKSKLKAQADFDETAIANGTQFTDSRGIVHTLDGKNTKQLKQKLEDLRNSGSATDEDIRYAREEYEKAQKLSITNNNTAQIRVMKEQLESYISDNASAFTGLISKDKNGNEIDLGKDIIGVSKDSTYEDINKAAIAAGNAEIEITNTTKYVRSKESLDASKNNK